jgi:hypothetical protein
MRCMGRLALLLACTLLLDCSRPSQNPLAGGLTPELEALLIQKTVDEIESAENFTQADFEQRQRKHLESMTKDMRGVALQNLQRRLDKITILGMSQTVELDRASASVDARSQDPKTLLALVTIDGHRSYHTNNASMSSETRFSLPWVITVDDGELVFRHRGIRMKDIAKPS